MLGLSTEKKEYPINIFGVSLFAFADAKTKAAAAAKQNITHAVTDSTPGFFFFAAVMRKVFSVMNSRFSSSNDLMLTGALPFFYSFILLSFYL